MGSELKDSVRTEAKDLKPETKLVRCEWPLIEGGPDVAIDLAVPPINASVKSKIEWLNAKIKENSLSENSLLYIPVRSASTADKVIYMLETLGVGSGWELNPECDVIEVVIPGTSLLALKKHGLTGIDWSLIKPLAAPQPAVVKIIDEGRIGDTYCFSEPINHAGVFNGILTGQCQEIVEVNKPGEIASCNLASVSLTVLAKGKLPRDAKGTAADFRNVVNFDLLGRITRSIVDNLEEIIDKNYYPLDPSKIKIPNQRDRPLGIGVSGFADLLYKIDLPYDDPRVELLNKMIFACMYFNGLVESHYLACQRGAYDTFKTGSYKKYVGEGKYEEVKGSPMSNGQFQFDLWGDEARILKDAGKLSPSYNEQDNIPVDPDEWGQMGFTFDVGDGKSYDQPLSIIHPDWDSLRQAIMKYGVRHSLLLALMPTASTASLMRNCEGTEVPSSHLCTRKVLSGEYTVMNRYAQFELKAINAWDEKICEFIQACNGSFAYLEHFIIDHAKEYPNVDLAELKWIVNKYKTMYEIKQVWKMKLSAQRGRYVDQAESFNIYMEGAEAKKLKKLHKYGHALRMKTGMYYLRQEPGAQCGNLTLSIPILNYHTELMRKLKKTVLKSDPLPKAGARRMASAPVKTTCVIKSDGSRSCCD